MPTTYPLPFCVYVLLSLKDHDFYVGYTTDLTRRLDEHFQGRNTSTAPRRPFVLVFCEFYSAKPDAERRETYLKTAKGRRTLRLMLSESLAGHRGLRAAQDTGDLNRQNPNNSLISGDLPCPPPFD